MIAPTPNAKPLVGGTFTLISWCDVLMPRESVRLCGQLGYIVVLRLLQSEFLEVDEVWNYPDQSNRSNEPIAFREC